MTARATTWPDQWARTWGWATVAGLECGLVGPFGSYPANPFNRIAFWVGLFWAGTLILWPSLRAARRLGPAHGVPPWFAMAAGLLAASLPLAAVAALACHALWPLHASGIQPLEWYGLTLMLAAPAAVLLHGLENRSAFRIVASPSAPPEPVPAPPAEPLPPALLASALCLQMEDHHVRVHLPTHSSLHLATLREAMDGLDPERGRQVHRSWWVARTAVTGWEEDGRALMLRLANGLRVPVARARVAALRADGWLG